MIQLGKMLIYTSNFLNINLDCFKVICINGSLSLKKQFSFIKQMWSAVFDQGVMTHKKPSLDSLSR